MKIQLARMTWREVEAAAREARGVAVLPIGATEQHGPHLPLDVDTVTTEVLALRAAERAGVVVAPALAYGNSRQNQGFAGTIAVRPTILTELVKDICASLVASGFDKLVLLNGHGGNYGPLSNAAEEVHYDTGALVCLIKAWELGLGAVPPPEGAPPWDGHAGSAETSLMLALRPEDVDRSQFASARPTVEIGPLGSVWPPQYPPHITPVHIVATAPESTPLGHFGEPGRAWLQGYDPSRGY